MADILNIKRMSFEDADRWRVQQALTLLKDYYTVFYDESQSSEQKSMAAIYACAAVYRALTLTRDEITAWEEKS